MPEKTIWVIEVAEGDYPDYFETLAARGSLESAKAWCNESRKLRKADPIIWDMYRDGSATGRCMQPYENRGKKYKILVTYMLNPVPYDE